ncbi:helix-turn-helix domain-containing protein [Streptomyces sp. NPDC048191]|uniref:helix-turn-helix domain-containing protein n=1 Tax=Streptomyces sp. NPDC048191 TaxID=3155484 RepID=UPI0033DBA4F0
MGVFAGDAPGRTTSRSGPQPDLLHPLTTRRAPPGHRPGGVFPRQTRARRQVLDLVASGRKVAEVARLLGISDQTIYVWRRQHLIDTGQLPQYDQQRPVRAHCGPQAYRRAGG